MHCNIQQVWAIQICSSFCQYRLWYDFMSLKFARMHFCCLGAIACSFAVNCHKESFCFYFCFILIWWSIQPVQLTVFGLPLPDYMRDPILSIDTLKRHLEHVLCSVLMSKLLHIGNCLCLCPISNWLCTSCCAMYCWLCMGMYKKHSISSRTSP